jgi:hypothetical protein
MSAFSPELIAYLILGVVERLGSVDAARAHIDGKKAEGKSFDVILDELEAERIAAAGEARAAVENMPDS